MIAEVGDRWEVRNNQIKIHLTVDFEIIILATNFLFQLWGDVSFGYGTDNNCEDWRYNVNGAVHSVLDWIAENAGEECA